jgi:hypothetical protein
MRPFTSVPSRRWVTLAAVCLSLPLGVRAEDPEQKKVTVKNKPAVLWAGGEVKTTVRTPRDPRNRELRVIVEGADYYASSDVQLDGVDAATTHQFTWKDLPGGPYRVDAILLRDDGEKTTVSDCFAVLSNDDTSGAGATAAFPTRRSQQQRTPKLPDNIAPNSGC